MDDEINVNYSGDLDDETSRHVFVNILKSLLKQAIKVENYELCKELKDKINEYEK